MRSLTRAGGVLAALCPAAMCLVGLGGVGVLPVAPAAAAGLPTATSSYTCEATGQTAADATTVSFTLASVPSDVRAGDTVSLQGTLAIALSANLTLQSRVELASEIGIASSDFSIDVQTGTTDTVLTASAAAGAEQAIASSSTVEASLTFPNVTIPDDTSSPVVLRMPTTATTASDVTGAPATVVFGAVLDQDSLLVPDRDLDCWLTTTGAPRVIATIPVSPKADGTTAEGPTAPAAGSSDTQTLAGAAVSAPSGGDAPSSGIGAPVPGSAGALAAPAATEPAAPAAAVAPQASLAEASVTIPPQTTGRGTFIPAWSLALTFALLPAAAVVYARRQRRRLRELVSARELPSTWMPR